MGILMHFMLDMLFFASKYADENICVCFDGKRLRSEHLTSIRRVQRLCELFSIVPLTHFPNIIVVNVAVPY